MNPKKRKEEERGGNTRLNSWSTFSLLIQTLIMLRNARRTHGKLLSHLHMRQSGPRHPVLSVPYKTQVSLGQRASS